MCICVISPSLLPQNCIHPRDENNTELWLSLRSGQSQMRSRRVLCLCLLVLCWMLIFVVVVFEPSLWVYITIDQLRTGNFKSCGQPQYHLPIAQMLLVVVVVYVEFTDAIQHKMRPHHQPDADQSAH